MYCENCGNKIDDDALFCDKCGALQNESHSTSVIPQETDVSYEFNKSSSDKHGNPKKRSLMKKIISAIISLVILAVGSIGLTVDFFAENHDSVHPDGINTNEDLIPMYRAYQSVLTKHQDGIKTLENENSKNSISSQMIAFADVVGDDKEELIFLACESYPGTEKLHIFTFVDGVAKEIFSDNLFIYAGQGLQPFMLFTLNEDKTLWLYRQTKDETEISTYYHFEEDSLNLTKSEKLKKSEVGEGIPTTGVRVWYTKDEKDCDQNAFVETDQYYRSNIDRIILVGATLFDEYYRDIIASRNDDGCLTYDEATKYLNGFSKSDSLNDENWKSSYIDFLANESFRDESEIRYSDETEILVYLYDLDHDGIPELLMTNGYSGRATRSAYIFTWSGEKVIYLGIGPGEPYQDPDDGISPLYANYWETYGVDHWSVYYKNGNSITTKDETSDPQLFVNKANFCLVQQKGLSDVQSDNMNSLLDDYLEAPSNSESVSLTAVSGNAEKQSPFTAKRIVFGLLAILGLCGSTVSMIVIVISKQATLTIITIIIYITASVGSVGSVTYSAVQNKVFITSPRTTQTISVDSDRIPSCEGMRAVQAQQQLESMGYTVRTEYSYSNTVPKDSVISQHTEEGTILIVVIIVSRGPDTAEKPSENITESTDKESPDGYSQKLTVTAEKGSSYASAVLYEWENGKWKEVSAYKATVGSNGIGDTVEGHSITPQGIHKLGVVLSEESVNTNMKTYRVSSSTCVVDDPSSKYYNQIMDKSNVPSGTHYDNIGKGLTNGTTYATIYIEHNGSGFSSKNVVPEKGSAIGVRGQYGEIKPNYGDVDISAKDMKDLLSKLDINKNPMIEIKVK